MSYRLKTIILVALTLILIPLIAIGEFKDGTYGVPNSTSNLSFFAATTSAQLAGVLSDETGSGGGFVRATFPTLAGARIATTALQCTGGGAPSSGAGLELAYNITASITAYDRDTPGWKGLQVCGLYVDIYSSGVKAARFGGLNTAIYGDLYYYGLLIDSTPFFEGDAVAEIKGIRGIDGKLDHESLPESAHKRPTFKEKKVTNRIPIADEDAIVDGRLKPDIKIDSKSGKFYVDEETTVQEEETPGGRDIGAMVSLLTRAVQQLTERIESLEAGMKK